MEKTRTNHRHNSVRRRVFEGAQRALLCSLLPFCATEVSASSAERSILREVGELGPSRHLENLPRLSALIESIEPAEHVDLHYREILDPRRVRLGSFSKGSTSFGSLSNPARVPESGPDHYFLSAHRGRVTRYGTESLVEGVLRAAARVNSEFPGVKTGLGNFSFAAGGDIPWSVSHNSGRDADVAFFFRDGRGRFVEAPTLLRVGGDGLSVVGRDWTLDVAASWAFVAALVEDKDTRVQWVFLSDPIRARLLAHAHEIGAPAETIAAASRVMRQPGRAAPHDDHFHIRVHCSHRDRLDGCVEWGPRRSDLEYRDASIRARTKEMIRGLSDQSPAVREAALSFLERWEPRESSDLLAQAIVNTSGEAQLRLLKVGIALGSEEILPALEAVVRSSDPEVSAEALRGVLAFGSELRAPVLARIAVDEELPLKTRREALVALQSSVDSETLPFLVENLPRLAPEHLDEAKRVLRRFTLHRPDNECGDVDSLHRTWSEWIRRERERLPELTWSDRRRVWFDEAFAGAGYAVGSFAEPNYSDLLRAIAEGPDELAWNADRRMSLKTQVSLPGADALGPQRAELWRRRASRAIASARND